MADEPLHDAVDRRDEVDDKPQLSKFWLGEITAAGKRDDAWLKRAKKVVERFRDERALENRAEKRANILWSNTEILKAALFQGVGNPDVRRRFPKKGRDDRAARTAALALERGLSYCADAYDADSPLENAVEDCLLPGRGQCWMVYDADVEEEDITRQEVRIDYVYYEDFRHSAGRTWHDVWWVARRHHYSRDELKQFFPKHANKIKLDVQIAGHETKKKDEDDTFKRAAVWEIWDKSKKERIYVAEGYPEVLRKDEDPYRLERFFPCPEPLYAVKTTQSLTPIPEYTLYRDQAQELDTITTRLWKLVDALRRRGVYDAGADGAENQLANLAHAGDNQFIPYRGFSALMEKGGLKNVFQTEDLAPIIAVVQALYEQRSTLIQTIYEITGISDVIRGATDPNETATAQRIKGQFGSLRLQKRQQMVHRFIRDLFRMKAEIIAEHFQREKIVEMTGLDMPLEAEKQQAQQLLAMAAQQAQQAQQQQQQAAQAAQMAQQGGQPQGGPPQLQAQQQPSPGALVPQRPMPQIPPEMLEEAQRIVKAPSWEEISDILRSDDRRGYKIDIETDATNRLNADDEKQQRIEFLGTMQQFMQASIPMVMQMPNMAPLVKETAMFTMRAFKIGRTMEEAFEEAFDQLANQPAPQQQVDPEQEAKAEQIKQAMQIEQQRFGMDREKHQGEMQLKRMELEGKQKELGLKAEQMELQLLGEVIDIEGQQQQQAVQAEANAIKLEGQVQDQQQRSEANAAKLDGMRADQENRAAMAQMKASNGASPKATPLRPAPQQQAPMGGLQQALMAMAEGISELAKSNQVVLQAVTAPKQVRIVRDQSGRAAGAVQTTMAFN